PYNWWNEDVIRYSKGDQRNFDLRAVFIFSDRHGGAAQRELSLARQTSTGGFTVAAVLVALGVTTFLFPSEKGRAKTSTRSVVRHLRERPCRKAQLDLSRCGGDLPDRPRSTALYNQSYSCIAALSSLCAFIMALCAFRMASNFFRCSGVSSGRICEVVLSTTGFTFCIAC